MRRHALQPSSRNIRVLQPVPEVTPERLLEPPTKYVGYYIEGERLDPQGRPYMPDRRGPPNPDFDPALFRFKQMYGYPATYHPWGFQY